MSSVKPSRLAIGAGLHLLAEETVEHLVDLLERVPVFQRVIFGRRGDAYLAGVEAGNTSGEARERRRCVALINERLAELERSGSRPRATTVLQAVRGRMRAGLDPRRKQVAP